MRTAKKIHIKNPFIYQGYVSQTIAAHNKKKKFHAA